MPHKVFWIWHMAPEQMPDCLVLAYWVGTETCKGIRCGTEEKFSRKTAATKKTLWYLCSAHIYFKPSPTGGLSKSLCTRSYSEGRPGSGKKQNKNKTRKRLKSLVCRLKDEAFKQQTKTKGKKKLSSVLLRLTAATTGRSSFPPKVQKAK